MVLYYDEHSNWALYAIDHGICLLASQVSDIDFPYSIDGQSHGWRMMTRRNSDFRFPPEWNQTNCSDLLALCSMLYSLMRRRHLSQVRRDSKFLVAQIRRSIGREISTILLCDHSYANIILPSSQFYDGQKNNKLKNPMLLLICQPPFVYTFYGLASMVNFKKKKIAFLRNRFTDGNRSRWFASLVQTANVP